MCVVCREQITSFMFCVLRDLSRYLIFFRASLSAGLTCQSIVELSSMGNFFFPAAKISFKKYVFFGPFPSQFMEVISTRTQNKKKTQPNQQRNETEAARNRLKANTNATSVLVTATILWLRALQRASVDDHGH